MIRSTRYATLATMAVLAGAALTASSASAAVGWSDSSASSQSTANCSGFVGLHGSTIGQWRDPQSSAYPIPGERHYGRISIGVGPTCTGTDTFRYFVHLPASTQFDPGADADGRVRCWYNTDPVNTPNAWNEITGTGRCIEPVNAGNGWWDLGVVTLGFKWGFEVHFPLKSTQTLNGNAMSANVFSGAGGPNAMAPQFPVTVYGAPVTSINSGPSGTTNNTSPNFGFGADKQVQGFECKLDSGSFSSCSSPKGYSGLGNGQHTFRARAISQGGTPTAEVTRTWTIDTVAPNATINSGPSGTTQQTSASFGFSSSESGSSFECRLDSGSYGSCSSPKGYSGLSDGSHTFQVRATDGAGNVGNPATRTWTVDSTGATVPPTTTITSGPAQGSTTSLTTVTFGFTSSKPSSSFECQAGGGSLPSQPFEPCTSPKAYTGLGDGAYTFKVRATSGGLLGNTATRQWSVRTSDQGGDEGGDDGGDDGPDEDGASGACTAAGDKVASAKKKLKKAKKSGKPAKVKKAKKKLKKAKAAQREACADSSG
jgi:hypothetical protein